MNEPFESVRPAPNIHPQTEVTSEQSHVPSVEELENQITEFLSPQQFVDTDWKSHTVYSIYPPPNSFEIVFFDPQKTPPIPAYLLKGKKGLVVGDKPNSVSWKNWNYAIDAIRQGSSSSDCLVLFVSADLDNVTQAIGDEFFRRSGEIKKPSDSETGEEPDDERVVSQRFDTLRTLVSASSRIQRKDDDPYRGLAELFLTYTKQEISRPILLKSRFPSLFLLAHMPEVEEMQIQEVQEAKIHVTVKSKDGYTLQYTLRPPLPIDFEGDETIFSEAVLDNSLVVAEWKILGIDGHTLDVMQIISNDALVSKSGKPPTVLIDTRLHRADVTDWESLADPDYVPGEDPDLDLIRTASVFSQSIDGMCTVGFASQFVNTIVIRLPIGDLSLDYAGHELGHLADPEKERDERDLQALLLELNKAKEETSENLSRLYACCNRMDKHSMNKTWERELDAIFRTGLKKIHQIYDDAVRQIYKSNPIRSTLERERTANAIWRRWLRAQPELRSRRKRTRDAMLFAQQFYQTDHEKKAKMLDPTLPSTEPSPRIQRWEQLAQKVGQIMGYVQPDDHNDELEMN
ncbi:hypothetical protein KBC79_06115 [Candidatus Woesebacteria bacterium]|nr:hypothetical protein [Candidatus Woesebacteria bacterium]